MQSNAYRKDDVAQLKDYRVILFLFRSVHDVIMADKNCQSAGIHCKIIPVPRSVTSQCGLCVEADPQEEKKIAAILDECGIIYSLQKDYIK